MGISGISRALRVPLALMTLTLLLAACGGSSDIDTTVASDTPPVATAATGIIVLLLTDAPTDALSAINIEVTEAILIGEMGQQTVFSGSKVINLLDLANYDQPIAFSDVEAGDYSKIRLLINRIELVDKATGQSVYPKLPANGKIDLLDQGGFTVLPGRILVAEIDMEANKSIHIVGTGSGKYQFRPVVKVNIMDGGLPQKLTRLEGVVAEIADDPAGRFLLCDADIAENCIIVNLAEGGSVFDAEGLPVSIGELMVGDTVVAIGRFRHVESDTASDEDRAGIELDAIVIEIGGTATQVQGVVTTAPDEKGQFALQTRQGDAAIVQLQAETQIIVIGSDATGPDAIVPGARADVDGVVIKAETTDDPHTIRAALVIVGGEPDADLLSGTIAEPLAADTMSFNLATTEGDRCVQVTDDGVISLVSQDADGTVIKQGEFADLEAGQSALAFGHMATDGCFQADDVVVLFGSDP